MNFVRGLRTEPRMPPAHRGLGENRSSAWQLDDAVKTSRFAGRSRLRSRANHARPHLSRAEKTRSGACEVQRALNSHRLHRGQTNTRSICKAPSQRRRSMSSYRQFSLLGLSHAEVLIATLCMLALFSFFPQAFADEACLESVVLD